MGSVGAGARPRHRARRAGLVTASPFRSNLPPSPELDQLLAEAKRFGARSQSVEIGPEAEAERELEWQAYRRLRALGLPGQTVAELATAAATVLEGLRERGILLP